MGVGRFACVAVPFGLTLASLICILIVMLAGITNKNLDMFTINVRNLTIDESSLANLENLVKRDPIPEDGHYSALTIAALGPGSTLPGSDTTNITASELGLADVYRVSLWNYCSVSSTGKTNCTKGKFDWASSATNVTKLEDTANTLTGSSNVTLPKEMKSALKTFSTVTKWTEVVYIIAILLAAVELFLGLFAICSRVGSCLTFLISGLATTTVIVASIMATVESSIVVAALKSTAKAYGVKASLNTSFLATTWLACAFSIGAGLFWAFSICCCAADHHKNNRKSRGGDHEKLIPTGQYQRVDDPHHFNNGQQTGVFNTGGLPAHNTKPQRGSGAYEPYSHTAI